MLVQNSYIGASKSAQVCATAFDGTTRPTGLFTTKPSPRPECQSASAPAAAACSRRQLVLYALTFEYIGRVSRRNQFAGRPAVL